MYRIRTLCLIACLLVSLLEGERLRAQHEDSSGAIFDSSRVATIRLEISPENWKRLTDSWREIPSDEHPYVPANFVWQDERVSLVGVRLKGNGSLAASEGKKFPFMVDMNRYVKGQKLRGLKKLLLHNGSVDPSQLREQLSYGAWLEEGMPTSRTGFADVLINDEPQGLYTVVEHMDDEFLERHFDDDTGALYKPEYPAGALSWRGDAIEDYENVDHQNRDDADHAAFIRFVDTINHESVESFPHVVDVDNVLEYFAGNTALGNFDTYATKAHNFYLFESTPGIFTILPWDMNLSQAGHVEVFPGGRYVPGEGSDDDRPEWDRRPLLDKLMDSHAHRLRYLEKVQRYLDGAASPGRLLARVDAAERLLGARLDAQALVQLRGDIVRRHRTLHAQVDELLASDFPTFVRGDCNEDGELNLSDAICALDWLFRGGAEPSCRVALNTNGDDRVDLTDAVALLSHLFRAAPAPAAPFPDCDTASATDYEIGCLREPASCADSARRVTP